MHIVIIGNGISGITAARNIRKLSDYTITVISAETDHFFSRTALMYIYMGHMKYEHTKPYEDWFWSKNKINLLKKFVEKVNTNEKELAFSDKTSLNYDKLIIACGSTPNKFGWPGQDAKGVQGLYSYQDLQSMEGYSKGLKKAVIVGGGLIGIEMAEMFNSRNIDITLLVRERSYWANVLPPIESSIINDEIRDHNIDLRLETELKEIVADKTGRVKKIITSKNEEISCQFVGLTAGVRPNIDFLKSSTIGTDKGILVNHFFETNTEDVYAIGDCAQFQSPIPGRRPIEQVWYTGRMHGETLAQTICREKTKYSPGVWFNSAKFFNIEYQTYGDVFAQNPDHIDSLYWKHPKEKKCIHIVYDKDSLAVKGINALGVRLRHEVFDKWLNTQLKLEYIVENFQDANFDPEFFKTYEKDLLSIYLDKFPNSTIKLNRKKRFADFFHFS